MKSPLFSQKCGWQKLTTWLLLNYAAMFSHTRMQEKAVLENTTTHDKPGYSQTAEDNRGYKVQTRLLI